MNILERLGNLDRRWWFLVLAVIVALPIVKPMGLPTSVGDWAKQTKETLDLVQPGDKVLFSCSYSAGGGPDVHPGAQVLFKILLNKGAKVILVSFTPQGDSFAEQICREAEAAGAKYGTDFVNLGFIAGAETAVATYAANPSGVFSNDFRGNPVSELPAYQGVTTAADFGLTVLVCTGMPGVEEWTRQITNPYKVPAIICVNTNGATRSVPYLQSGQIQGLVAGLKGSAEMEQLYRLPGTASAGMDAQSLGHLFMLFLIIMANVSYLAERKTAADRRGATKK